MSRSTTSAGSACQASRWTRCRRLGTLVLRIPAGWWPPPPDAAAEQTALTRTLDAALTHLRPEYREAVILRYREDLSVEEIGQAMAIPVGTVKTYLFRARKQMAGLMTASGWGRSPAETTSGNRP